MIRVSFPPSGAHSLHSHTGIPNLVSKFEVNSMFLEFEVGTRIANQSACSLGKFLFGEVLATLELGSRIETGNLHIAVAIVVSSISACGKFLRIM